MQIVLKNSSSYTNHYVKLYLKNYNKTVNSNQIGHPSFKGNLYCFVDPVES